MTDIEEVTTIVDISTNGILVKMCDPKGRIMGQNMIEWERVARNQNVVETLSVETIGSRPKPAERVDTNKYDTFGVEENTSDG